MKEMGQRFGSYTVIGSLPSRRSLKGNVSRMVQCRCDCGNEYAVRLQNLRSGKSKQCRKCAVQKRKRHRKFNDDSVNRLQCFKNYERGAINRGLSFDLTLDEFGEITNEPCEYCGAAPGNIFNLKHKGTDIPRASKPFIYNGIDRVNNSIGYNKQNCVACCIDCNRAKNDRSINEFRQWITKVYEKMRLRNIENVEALLTR